MFCIDGIWFEYDNYKNMITLEFVGNDSPKYVKEVLERVNGKFFCYNKLNKTIIYTIDYNNPYGLKDLCEYIPRHLTKIIDDSFIKITDDIKIRINKQTISIYSNQLNNVYDKLINLNLDNDIIKHQHHIDIICTKDNLSTVLHIITKWTN